MSKNESIRVLFKPNSIAVVGATPDLGKPGGRCLFFLKRFGYCGEVFPINAKYTEIEGLKCYADLRSVPKPVDLVILLVPANSVPEYLKAASYAGIKAAIVCTSGFAEAGDHGVALQKELVVVAKENRIAVLGPNCLGLVDLHTGLTATFTTALEGLNSTVSGPVAFISQSGAMGAAVFALAQAEEVGVGKFVSTGNEAVLDFTDFLEYLSDDQDVSLILGYVEAIRDGRRFISVARQARARGKRVALLKVGKSEAGGLAARSHTGALAGSSRVYEAAFRRAGVLSVADVRTLLDLAITIPNEKVVQGRGVGIISMSGGAGVMMTDGCIEGGLVVPPLSTKTQSELLKFLPDFVSRVNPVDYGPIYGNVRAIGQCIEITGADPSVDILLVFLGLSPSLAGIIDEHLLVAKKRCGKPLIVAWMGGPKEGLASLRKAGIAAFDDPTRAVEMAIQLCKAGASLSGPDLSAQPQEATPLASVTKAALRSAIAVGKTQMSEREVKSLMARYEIPVIPEVLVKSVEEAEAAAIQFGQALAVKAEAAELIHKSDVGAVRLGVLPSNVRRAYNDVVAAAVEAVGAANVTGALIQPMAKQGLEVLAGLRYDPQFGPTITVGMGGTTSEVLSDVATEVAPIDLATAHSMLRHLRCAPLFGAFRGAVPRDTEALAAALVSLSKFAMDAGSLVSELDLNPIIVHDIGEGCTIVDAAAVLGTD